MNDTLIYNWNNTINDNDTVYFLGDMSMGIRPYQYWLDKLNGRKFCIKGSHDNGLEATPLLYIEVDGLKILLIHDPHYIPQGWDGWTIHGHKHNNNIAKYPFINGLRKTINVSVELINYKPVSLDFLLSLNVDNIRRMDTVNSYPQYGQGSK